MNTQIECEWNVNYYLYRIYDQYFSGMNSFNGSFFFHREFQFITRFQQRFIARKFPRISRYADNSPRSRIPFEHPPTNSELITLFLIPDEKEMLKIPILK